jgi:hypothetical protein
MLPKMQLRAIEMNSYFLALQMCFLINLWFFANMKANLLQVLPCYSFLQETIANKLTPPSGALNFGMCVILKNHPILGIVAIQLKSLIT